MGPSTRNLLFRLPSASQKQVHAYDRMTVFLSQDLALKWLFNRSGLP